MPEPDVANDRAIEELGYLRGLIDAMRTAPQASNVGPFLDRMARAVTALDAVRTRAANWETQSHQPPRGPITEEVILVARQFSKDILEDIANTLAGKGPRR